MNLWIVCSMMRYKRTGAFHAYMFHGTQDRVGARNKYVTSHSLGEDLSQLLKIKRNMYIMPDVFLPSTSLIVSESARVCLSALPNIRFLDVEFAKFVYVPFAVASFNYETIPEIIASGLKDCPPDQLIERLPPARFDNPPKYYEVLVPRLVDLRSADERRFKFLYEDPDDGIVEHLAFSPAIFATYSIVLSQFGFIVSDDGLDALRGSLDMDYFYISALSPSTD